MVGEGDSDCQEGGHTELINAVLQAHFDYADECVTCQIVKTFLPSMASPDLVMTIPTPITVHIDQCQSCQNDLLAIQSLHLSEVQLQKLTYGLNQASETTQIEHAHLHESELRAIAGMTYEHLDSYELEHACTCHTCQERLLSVRETLQASCSEPSDLCETLDWEDLFDFVFPIGSNPLSDEYIAFRKATIEHIGSCGHCQKRLKQLNQLIVQLMHPNGSPVVTRFELHAEPSLQSNDLYGDYPVRVHTQFSLDTETESPLHSEQTDGVQNRKTRIQLGWMKLAAMVAIVLSITVFSMLPKAGAGFWDEVYEATVNVPVVHVKMCMDSNQKPIKESWIFTEGKLYQDEGDRKIFYDTNRGSISTYNDGEVEVEDMQVAIRDYTQSQINGLCDLWPLEKSLIANPVSNSDPKIDQYEARWIDEENNEHVWNASVDALTNRVVSVKRYLDVEGDLELQRVFIVDYPTVSEANQAVESWITAVEN